MNVFLFFYLTAEIRGGFLLVAMVTVLPALPCQRKSKQNKAIEKLLDLEEIHLKLNNDPFMFRRFEKIDWKQFGKILFNEFVNLK